MHLYTIKHRHQRGKSPLHSCWRTELNMSCARIMCYNVWLNHSYILLHMCQFDAIYWFIKSKWLTSGYMLYMAYFIFYGFVLWRRVLETFAYITFDCITDCISETVFQSGTFKVLCSSQSWRSVMSQLTPVRGAMEHKQCNVEQFSIHWVSVVNARPD